MKQFFFGAIIIIFMTIGWFIGHYIHHHFASFGVNYVRMSDVMEAYILPIVIFFFIGLVTAVFVDSKI